jgi:hypothetical protein
LPILIVEPPIGALAAKVKEIPTARSTNGYSYCVFTTERLFGIFLL